MSRLIRQAKYLIDLNFYTKREINILYYNGYGREPSKAELKRLAAKAVSLDDNENLDYLYIAYGYGQSEGDDTDSGLHKRYPPVPKEEIDAFLARVRASCVGPIKPPTSRAQKSR